MVNSRKRLSADSLLLEGSLSCSVLSLCLPLYSWDAHLPKVIKGSYPLPKGKDEFRDALT